MSQTTVSFFSWWMALEPWPKLTYGVLPLSHCGKFMSGKYFEEIFLSSYVPMLPPYGLTWSLYF